MEKFIIGVIVFLVSIFLLAVGLAGYAMFYEAKRPTISLAKDEWYCSETKTVYRQTTSVVGKLIIPQTTREEVCINYSRK